MKNENILFSVIIPLFNKADTIERTLQSVVRQTFDMFEVIVIDDGSSDNCAALAEAMCPLFNGRLTVVHQQNAGVSVARNAGAKIAHGKYLAFLDADDEWHPDYLREMRDGISHYPDAVVLGMNYAKVFENKYSARHYLCKCWRIVDLYREFPWWSPLNSSSIVVKQDYYLEIGGLVPGHAFYEDAEFLFKLAANTNFIVSTKIMVKYNSDSNVHATGHKRSFSEYAHWQYLEQRLNGGGNVREKYLARWEMLRRYVEYVLHHRYIDLMELMHTFPMMCAETGTAGRWMCGDNKVLSILTTVLFKVFFVVVSHIFIHEYPIRRLKGFI